MTYAELQDLSSLFLGGDYTLPKEESRRLVALKAAYSYASTKCTALKLLTSNKDNAIMRMGPGESYVRMPKLPRDTTDTLDIDSELGPAIARIIAHYVAKDIKMKDYHKAEAIEIMRDYEGKVAEFMDESYARGEYDQFYTPLEGAPNLI